MVKFQKDLSMILDRSIHPSWTRQTTAVHVTIAENWLSRDMDITIWIDNQNWTSNQLELHKGIGGTSLWNKAL